MFATLTQYDDRECDGAPISINPAEVACVRPWQYHSFRPAISEIVLKCGEKIHVWQDRETVVKRLAEAQKGPTP